MDVFTVAFEYKGKNYTALVQSILGQFMVSSFRPNDLGVPSIIPFIRDRKTGKYEATANLNVPGLYEVIVAAVIVTAKERGFDL